MVIDRFHCHIEAERKWQIYVLENIEINVCMKTVHSDTV